MVKVINIVGTQSTFNALITEMNLIQIEINCRKSKSFVDSKIPPNHCYILLINTLNITTTPCMIPLRLSRLSPVITINIPGCLIHYSVLQSIP